MKRIISIIAVCVCISVLLASCNAVPSFSDREKYSEYLQGLDYGVYIVTSDSQSAPMQLRLLSNTVESWLKAAGVPVMTSMLLAADGEMKNVQIVCYFDTAEDTEKAYSVVEKQQGSKLTFEFTCETKDNAIKLNITLK